MYQAYVVIFTVCGSEVAHLGNFLKLKTVGINFRFQICEVL